MVPPGVCTIKWTRDKIGSYVSVPREAPKFLGNMIVSNAVSDAPVPAPTEAFMSSDRIQGFT